MSPFHLSNLVGAGPAGRNPSVFHLSDLSTRVEMLTAFNIALFPVEQCKHSMSTVRHHFDHLSL